MDACVVHEIGERSDMFLFSDIDQEHLLSKYRAPTKKNGDYPKRLKVEAGSHSTRYWDKDEKPIRTLVHHTGLVCTVRVVVRSVWIGVDAWGWVCDATDIQSQDDVCTERPF
jgi:hypothetical protein